MVVNYCGKKFYNIGPSSTTVKSFIETAPVHQKMWRNDSNHKLRPSKVLQPRAYSYKTYFVSFTFLRNKLERLSVASIFSLVEMASLDMSGTPTGVNSEGELLTW